MGQINLVFKYRIGPNFLVYKVTNYIIIILLLLIQIPHTKVNYWRTMTFYLIRIRKTSLKLMHILDSHKPTLALMWKK
jgi:hypothetical protein